ncbi:hypothetical protein Tco_1021612 [Tanacetum coccineum]
MLLKEDFLLNKDQKLSEQTTNQESTQKSNDDLLKAYEESDEDFASPIGSAEDERLIKKMNEKGVDLSKSEVIKEESKEEVQKESKKKKVLEKENLAPIERKIKVKKSRYIQNTSEDDSDKENDELRLHLTIAPDEEKEVDYEILDRKYPIKEWKTECLGTKPQADQAEHIEEINQNMVIRSNGQKRYFSTLMRVLSIMIEEDLNAVYHCNDRFQEEIPKAHVLQGTYLSDLNRKSFHMLVEKRYPLRKEILNEMMKLEVRAKKTVLWS